MHKKKRIKRGSNSKCFLFFISWNWKSCVVVRGWKKALFSGDGGGGALTFHSSVIHEPLNPLWHECRRNKAGGLGIHNNDKEKKKEHTHKKKIGGKREREKGREGGREACVRVGGWATCTARRPHIAARFRCCSFKRSRSTHSHTADLYLIQYVLSFSLSLSLSLYRVKLSSSFYVPRRRANWI